MGQFQHLYGKLSYRQKATGRERGREFWSLTRNRDGTRTMRCLSMTDDSAFVRDATYTLGLDHRPADVFVRLQVADQFVGAGYFRVDGDQLHVVADGAAFGRAVQTLQVPRLFHIETHAVMLDGWFCWCLDLSQPGEQQVVHYNTSTRWNGIDGPLGRLEAISATIIGDEQIRVPAGTFQATHFRLTSGEKSIAPADLWVTGSDHLLVKYDWNEFGLEYILESLAPEGAS
ncbi:MAG: hypothetical protein RMM98_10800 [Acidobacteriota bacterium]|nr:hypothetical protein [Blastocatellia bacterium]MDW8240095.1 hypothetical protein [Acidobacteriota bacterium]